MIADAVGLVSYKLRRARQLGTPRYARWLLLKRLGPGVVLTSELSDGLVIQHQPNGNVSRDLYLGQHECDVVDFFSHYLQPGMTVFDVGANIGVYSLVSAKRVGATGAVHCFEPTPTTFAQLKNNVALNGLSCVRVNQLAVCDRSGVSMLHLYRQDGMNSLARQDWVGPPMGEVQVPTISLDEYVRENRIPRVDLLKMDVEGAELAVLQGARELLTGASPPVVVCEFADRTTRAFGYRADDIRAFLERLDYRFFRWNPDAASLVPETRQPNYRLYANLVCMSGRG